MSTTELISSLVSTGMRLIRGRVSRVEPNGSVLVSLHELRDDQPSLMRCNVLLPAGGASLRLEHDQEVLVAGDADLRQGIVLGVIGRAGSASDVSATAAANPGTPAPLEDRVVLKAAEELVLQVGEASIRITSDGRVILRGENILQRAKGTLRLKGGSVAIN